MGTLPVSATVAQHAASFDFDGHGAINGNEFIALTNAANPSSLFRVLGLVRNGTNVDLTYTTDLGHPYSFEFTGNLMTPWIPIPGTIPASAARSPPPSARHRLRQFLPPSPRRAVTAWGR